jgi:ABC-2 type transport system ATP-binding protein
VIRKQGKNKTVLFSSHILQEVEALCDRVIIINKGELVADDRLSNLQLGSKEKHVVMVQFKESVQRSMMENLKDVSAVEETQASNFKLQTSNPESVRRQILELAIKHNLNIISIQSGNQSLEDVFRNLTVPGN